MKNQYVADAGDYGKYGLLRYMSNAGIKIAVNWYLTKDDGSNDGNHISYLNNPAERKKDPVLFDFLKTLVDSSDRNVVRVEAANIIPGAVYYHALLDVSGCETTLEKRARRFVWHRSALDACASADLVFLDPDTGLKADSTRDLTDAVKYAFVSEVADYYTQGQNVAYYCSKYRRTEEAWDAYKHMMLHFLPDAKLLAITFHGGTQRTYVFVLHESGYPKYKQLLTEFVDSPWKRGRCSFTAENI